MEHLERARQEGRKVVVEDVRRGRENVRRAVWGAVNNSAPNAMPVYVVGLQRSGTNMLFGGFVRAPEVEAHNEHDCSRAFTNMCLRDDDVIRSIVESSRHRCVVFKPLADSHRVVHLLDELGAPTPGRAIWIYRDFADRVRSVIAKWPQSSGATGRKVAAGTGGFEAGGLSEERLAFLSELDPEEMSHESGAALYWYLRNGLFFDLGLDQRADVALISYDHFLTDPERHMARLCEFIGIQFRPEMVAGVARRPPPTRVQLDIDTRIAALCNELQQRLDGEFERRLSAGMLTATARETASPRPSTSGSDRPSTLVQRAK